MKRTPGRQRHTVIQRCCLAVAGGLALAMTACSTPAPDPDPRSELEVACTLIGPPFGVAFDLSALNEPPPPLESPLMADYCADGICQSVEVRQLSADLGVEGVDPGALFISALDMASAPTVLLRLHDGAGSVSREVSTALQARAVSSDINGTDPRCLAEGHWAAVRVEPDGSLTDVTATTPLPESLQAG